MRYVQNLKFQSYIAAQIDKNNQQYNENNKTFMIMLHHF